MNEIVKLTYACSLPPYFANHFRISRGIIIFLYIIIHTNNYLLIINLLITCKCLNIGVEWMYHQECMANHSDSWENNRLYLEPEMPEKLLLHTANFKSNEWI